MEKLRKFPKTPESLPEWRFYNFGPFQIDATKRLLFRENEPLSISPKTFDLLIALVQHHGDVLVKDELLTRLWPDAVVEEGNLNRQISTLRKILGESPDEHNYIVTIPGRGYRFVAEVRESWEEESTPPLQNFAQIPALAVPPTTPSITSSATPAEPARSRLDSSWFISWFIGGIVMAASVLAFVWTFTPHPPPKRILTDSDQILISDFTNSTGDPIFDDTLKQAVSVQLEQSPYLAILSEASIRSTLQLMTKAPDTKLTPEIARDVCQRLGGKAYVSGSIATLGNEFVLGLSAIDCVTGDTLAREQATAVSKERVLSALDMEALRMRNRLGESPNSIAKFETPLEQATTPSLEALKAFSKGNQVLDTAGDAAAIPFFQRAIDLDPNFSLAYDAIGIAYSNLDEPGLASENISRAFELRNRASEREKFQIAANFSQIVTGDLEKANQVCEVWSHTYPRDAYPHNLLGVNYEFLGQYQKAVTEMSEAVRLNPDGVILRSNLMDDYIALGRLNDAKGAYNLALARKLDHPFLHADRYAIAFLDGDKEEMDRQLDWSAGRTGAEDLLLSIASDTSASAGNLRRAREQSRQAIASALHNGQKETAALWQMNAALREAEFGNFHEARKQTAEALSLASSRDVQLLAALTFARSGDSLGAEKLATDLARRFPQNTVIVFYWLPSIHAAIELSRNNPAKAVHELRATTQYDLSYPNPQVEVARFLYPAYLRGLAYLEMRKWVEASAEFRKFADNRSIVGNCPLGPLSQLNLARAYMSTGDKSNSRATYQALFNVWQQADAGIPVVEQARLELVRLD